MSRFSSRVLGAILSVAVISSGGVILPVAANAVVSPAAAVVINEVYGGGGNSGAPLDRDFIELYNTSDAPVDVTGWSVQYASAAGTTWQLTLLSGSIAAGDHLLVGEALGSGAALPDLPPVDVSGSIAMSATSGKVALVSASTALSCGTALLRCQDLVGVLDLVGYGTASDFAGSAAAPALSNSTSASRSAAHTNTGDNAADFTAGAPSPVASGSAPDPEPVGPIAATIREIQGTSSSSPLVAETVVTRGIVTAVYATGGFNGYVIQTPGTGGGYDPAAQAGSDAVFVYSPATVGAVVIGDSVEVTGTVSEFNGLTEITVPSGGLIIGAEPAAAATALVIDAFPAAATAREALESMLVELTGEYTVSNTYPTSQYGEVGLAFGSTPLRQPTDVARPGTAEAAAVAADNAARGVILDDGASTNFLSSANSALTPPYVSLENPVRVGATADFGAAVILDYRNNSWKLNPVAPVTAADPAGYPVTFSNTRTAAPDAEAIGAAAVRAASFNVLNYFTTLGIENPDCVPYTDRAGDGVTVRGGCPQRGAWDAADFARQQDKIVAAITALDADVIGLLEIENSAVLGEAADEALASLTASLNTIEGAGTWDYVHSSSDLPPVSEMDVISNAIIYRTAVVDAVGGARALGEFSGDGEAFGNAREPIAQVFTPDAGGDEFLFVVNHFKSKGSAGPLPGDLDSGDGQGASNASRMAQATALRDWVAAIQGDVNSVLLAGDFNAYGKEDPLQVLYDAGFSDVERALGVETASYSFSGLSGSLDHILVNSAALARATGADIWNINSGESVALEYSRYNSHGTIFYAADAYRSSDHDPVLLGLAAEDAPLPLTLLNVNDFHGRIDANTVAFAGTIEQLRAAADGPVLFTSSGDNLGASLFASAIAHDQPTIDVLNALDLTASAVGNHEFDQGWLDLRDRIQSAADWDYLGANVYQAGTQTPVLDEYALVAVDGMTVGIIGAVTAETSALVSPAGISTLSFGDPVQAVNRVAAQLSDGDEANGEADVLIANYHEGAGYGTPDGSTLEQELAADGVFQRIVNDTAASVDAILGGHTHKEYAWSAAIPGTDRTRPVVQSASYGTRIGKVTLSVDPDTFEVTAHTQQNVERTTTAPATLIASYPRVAEVNAIVTTALADAAAIGNTRVGSVSADITTAYIGSVRDDRASESTLGNLVANALRDSLSELSQGAQIGVVNPGGLRAELFDTQAEFGGAAVPGLADGDISYSQANAVLPFNNTLTISTLTGAQVKTMLEQQWQRSADGTVPSRAYLQLGLSDNVSYTYDASLAEGSRITSITVDGAPMNPVAQYRIGTFSFLSSGGDNFHVFRNAVTKIDTGLVDRDAWIDYISAGSPLAPSFARHAVSVSPTPVAAVAGESLAFQLAKLDLSSLGSPANTSVSVRLDGVEIGTVTVTAGAASVNIVIPASTPVGTAALTIVATPSGTTVTLPLLVRAPPVMTTTSLVAIPPVHINNVLRATLLARVAAADDTRAAGTVQYFEGTTLVGTSTVRFGLAAYTLPNGLERGTHSYTAVFTPSDPAAYAGSTSAEASVRVLF